MDVLLLIPPEKWSYQIIPDLGLGYLATALRGAGYEPRVLDCRQARYNLVDLKDYISKNPPDVIGIKFHSPGFERVREATAMIRQILPDVPIIVGGPHPSSDPEGTLNKLSEVDYLIQGEGEASLPMILESIVSGRTDDDALSRIPGLGWRSAGEVRLNDPCFSTDLDALGFPAWDLIDPMTYPDEAAGVFVKSFPTAPVLTSRGCPYNCTFCAGKKVLGRKIRYRSPGHVLDEIELLRKDYGVNNFNFVDDNLTFSPEFAHSLCEEIIQRANGIYWTLPNGVRVDTLDAELLKLMERSGCYQMALGIESGSDRVLKIMKKSTDTEAIRKACELIKDNTKIKLTGFFIMGFPGETREDLEKTIKFLLSLPLDHVHLCTYIPIPGTESYNNLVEKGLIDPETIDYDMMTVDSPWINTDALPAAMVRRRHQYAYLRFYLRPRVLANLVTQINTPGQFWMLMRRFIRLFI